MHSGLSFFFIFDQVLMLQTRLAATENMTHDVIRDLLGVKLDITDYAVSFRFIYNCGNWWMWFLIALRFCIWYVLEFDRRKPNCQISGGGSAS